MADAKISALDAKTTVHDTDVFPIVDIEAETDETKKITGANMKTEMTSAHAALTTGVHGAGANTLLYSNHNVALSSSVHPDTSYCYVEMTADQGNIPTTRSNIRVQLDNVIVDTGSNWSNAFIYNGTRADADSSSTKIEDDDAAFDAKLTGQANWYVYVEWASDAGKTTNLGTGYAIRTNDATLTITKATGADFAASYYYWIKRAHYVVPTSGLYLVSGGIRVSSTEADKKYGVSIVKDTGAGYSGSLSQWTSGTGSLVYVMTTLASLVAGEFVSLGYQHYSLAAASTVGYQYNQTFLKIKLVIAD